MNLFELFAIEPMDFYPYLRDIALISLTAFIVVLIYPASAAIKAQKEQKETNKNASASNNALFVDKPIIRILYKKNRKI